MSSAPQVFPAFYPVPFILRIVSALRSLWVTFITDNPLTWSWQQGRRNPRADMEGPLYVINSPHRQFERGKAVMATIGEIKESAPFLVTISVRDHKGEPLPNVQLDWWQANSQGQYYYRSYGLRGKVTTDDNGNVEVLTIAPGRYGRGDILRAAHIHIMFSIRDSIHDRLTTQLYICQGNDPSYIKGKDILNAMRTPREANILQAWCIPSKQGAAYLDLPTLDQSDMDSVQRVEWWNQKLEQQAPGQGLRVVAGGHTTFTLNVKPGFFGF